MRHDELVQLSTDLLSEVQDPTNWLPLYDAALAAGDDHELAALVARLQRALDAAKRRIAA